MTDMKKELITIKPSTHEIVVAEGFKIVEKGGKFYIEPDKKETSKYTDLREYIKSLDKPGTYDKWRYAYDLWVKYHNSGKNPDDYIDEIIKKVEKYK